MESFPTDWVTQLLEGPLTFRGVDYFASHNEVSESGKETELFQCLLCNSKGYIKSPQSCLEHCRGRRHQRQYQFLVQQQQAWLEDQLVPDSFGDGDNGDHNASIPMDEEDVLGYFMPFRRWHFGKWEVGLSCQLCGTAAFPNRHAIVEHCQSSRRHIVLRNRTLYSSRYHPEITEHTDLLERLERLPYQYYGWNVQRMLLRYLAAKEVSMASLTSRRYAWYQVWKMLEMYELRYRMSILECAIWKHDMLEYDQDTTFSTLGELEECMRTYGLDYQLYRQERRKTSQATAVILGVIPFLKEETRVTTNPEQ